MQSTEVLRAEAVSSYSINGWLILAVWFIPGMRVFIVLKGSMLSVVNSDWSQRGLCVFFD